MRGLMRMGCAIGVLAMVLAGCAAPEGDDGGSPSPTPPPGNGALYLGTGSSDAQRYPIQSDGTLGSPTGFRVDGSVVDGRGDAVLTGVFEDVYSVRLDVRDAGSGEVVRSVDEDWCGGEGAEGRACVLLDPGRVARTSTLWAGRPGGTVTISSLEDGADVRSLGEVAGLVGVIGTESADALMLSLADGPMTGGDLGPLITPSGTVQRLDLQSGSTTELGAYPEQFTPLCAVGLDSLLGYVSPLDGSDGGGFALAMVGPAAISPGLLASEVGIWPTGPPRGCSADGRFVYAPVREGDALGLERIALADGSRAAVPGIAVLPEALFAITR